MRKTIPLRAAVLAILASLALRGPGEARPDAVSAASLSVRVPTVTATTAVIEYFNDKYNYGTRTLCYDPAPASPVNNCTVKTASGNQGSFNVSGLQAATRYNFSIKAIDTKDNERPYTTTGNFTTTGSTAISVLGEARSGSAPAKAFDVRGRALPGELPGARLRIVTSPVR